MCSSDLSNWINIKLADEANFAEGNYIVRVSNDLLDPFERQIDANNDGILTENEEYLSVVTVKRMDVAGPTLRNIRFVSEDNEISPDNGAAVYEFDVSDDLSGVKYLAVRLSLKGTSKIHEEIACGENCKIENGIVKFEIPKSNLLTN